ncbi:hypothetical protein [Rickettsia felis]|nr:hypothetical protein [Rickettsia felis]
MTKQSSKNSVSQNFFIIFSGLPRRLRLLAMTGWCPRNNAIRE